MITDDLNHKVILPQENLTPALTGASFSIRLISLLTIAITILNMVVGDNRNGQVSKQYFINVTPPGIFFAIWGVIYSTFYLSAIYAFFKNIWQTRTWILFAAWNLCGTLWTLLFDTGSRAGVLISIPILFVILIVTQNIWVSLVQNHQMNNLIGTLIRNCFGIGLGWMIAASNLGLGILMVHYLGFTLNQQLIAFWILVPLSYETVYWYNLSRYPVKYSIGLILTTIYVLLGASISSLSYLHQNAKIQNNI